MLIDVHQYGLTGRQAEQALLDSGIVTNRNAIPQDPNGAWYTSGIRIGTPALTTRGLGTAEMDQIAELIHTVLDGTEQLCAARLAAAGARRELVTQLPPEAEPYRAAAREAAAIAHGLDPAAARRALAPTGYAAPHLSEPYGLGAGPVRQLAVQRELADAGVKVSDLGIATWVVPSLIAYGTQEQRDRHLPATLRGEVLWCQLFSEPGAGSDLASLRTRAVRTEDGGWRVDGQKVWTSAAQWSDWGILLARTDPAAPKHEGLTFFLVDMKNTPGIDVRPLKEITGDSLFNEVYFDGVRLPADAVVGEVGDGWRVARHTLGNERVHMADQLTFSTGLEALIARLGEAHAADSADGADGADRRTRWTRSKRWTHGPGGRHRAGADRGAGRRGARPRLHRPAHHPPAGRGPRPGRGRQRTEADPDPAPAAGGRVGARTPGPAWRAVRGRGGAGRARLLDVALSDHRGRHHPGPAQRGGRTTARPAPRPRAPPPRRLTPASQEASP